MNAGVQVDASAQIASLAEVLAYRNQDIIDKFQENWDVTEDFAAELFEETKKWLWLSADSIYRESIGETVPPLAIGFSMTLLDEMWHTFILFTKDYQAFCKQYFGFYINHAPTTKREKEAVMAEYQADPEAYEAKLEQEISAQYSYIYDRLGGDTLSKWYGEWTDLVSPEYLSQLRKQPWNTNA
jgi:hypothetical protein